MLAPGSRAGKDEGRLEGERPAAALALPSLLPRLCAEGQVAHAPRGTLGRGTSAQPSIHAELTFWCLMPNESLFHLLFPAVYIAFFKKKQSLEESEVF